MKFYIYVIIAVILFLLLVYLCFARQINTFIVTKQGKKRIQKKLYNACKLENYLIMSDLHLNIDENRYKRVDTIIIGNKYIYITKELLNKGKIIVTENDLKWRIINNDNLINIDNPFLYNDRIINRIHDVMKKLDHNRIINLVVTSYMSTIEEKNKSHIGYVISENDVIDFIKDFEDKSPLTEMDDKTQENIAMDFYNAGMKNEKIIKNYKK